LAEFAITTEFADVLGHRICQVVDAAVIDRNASYHWTFAVVARCVGEDRGYTVTVIGPRPLLSQSRR
jgi:hypothetical protein